MSNIRPFEIYKPYRMLTSLGESARNNLTVDQRLPAAY
jgi:hypothetical protein